jgi:tetratricopeptide (TPR) repeat protein
MLDAEEFLHLAIHASSAGQHHACLTYLKEVLQRQPDNGRAIYLLAVQHAELGLIERAIGGMQAALVLEPRLEIARFQLGLLLLDRRKPADAKEQFAELHGSADAALRMCAEAMSALADNDVASARAMLEAGLSQTRPSPALAALMQRLLDALGERAAATAVQESSVRLGAYGEIPAVHVPDAIVRPIG